MSDYTITDRKTSIKVTVTETDPLLRPGFEHRKAEIQIAVQHPAGWGLTWNGSVSIDEYGQVNCPLVDHLDPNPEQYMGKDAPTLICGIVEDALSDYGSQYNEVDDPEGEYKDA